MKLTMRRAAAATAGVFAAGGLVLGGTEAFASSPASTAPTASAPAAPKAACKQAKQARHPRACAERGPAAGLGRRAGGRLGGGLLGLGVHGQATVKGADGGFTVQEWQTGKVASISGESVTVTDASGTTWTWTVQSSTRYRVSGAAGSLSGVHVGDTVVVRGVENGGANDVTALDDPDQSKLGKAGSQA